MTGKFKIERRREENRRLALLALAGSEASPTGECPDDEELAVLLDGGCDPPRQRQLWEHLASCRDCYQRWFESAGALAESGGRTDNRGNTVRFWSGPRVLAAAGSLCAAAAAVAVFWTTPFYQQDGSRYRVPTVETPAETGTDSESDSLTVETGPARSKSSTAPRALPGEADRTDAGPAAQNREPPAESSKPGSIQSEDTGGRISKQAQQHFYQQPAAEAEDYGAFLERAAVLCRSEAPVPVPERREIIRQGRKLTAGGVLSASQRRSVSQLLELLENLQGDEKWCARLAQLLNKYHQERNGSRNQPPASKRDE